MRRLRISYLALAFFQLFSILRPTDSYGAFSNFVSGARAPGMADSFVGVADDANALYYNPAGLTQLPEGELSTEYGQLLKGLNDGSKLGSSFFGYAQPLKEGRWGSMGVGYHQFNAANLFNERMITLAYGRVLKNRPGVDGVFSGGFSIKNLYREYQPDRFTENGINDNGVASGQRDALFAKNGYSKSAFAIDLSGLYRFGPGLKYSAGINIVNANQPDVSLSGSGDKAPLATKVGLGYRPSRLNLFSAELRRTNRLEGSPDVDFAFGAEHRFAFERFGAIEVRGGYAEGARGFRSMTAGFSYFFSKAELDYALTLPVGGLGANQESHRVGFTVKLGHSTNAQTGENTDESGKYSLIKSFENNPKAAQGIISRLTLASNLSERQRSILLQLLLKRYLDDAPGIRDVNTELVELIKDPDVELMDWENLKKTILSGIQESDKEIVETGLEDYKAGHLSSALSHWLVTNDLSRERISIKGLILAANVELAADAYRQKNIDLCIDKVLKLIDILPNDKELLKGYRELLEQRSATQKQIIEQSKPKKAEVEVPVIQETKQKSEPTTLETMAQSYGLSLGYYFTRKVNGATRDELIHLLNQMKAVYGQFNMDLSVVDKELENLANEITVPVKAAPVSEKIKEEPKLKIIKPEIEKPKKVFKEPVVPVETIDRTELNRAWAYYQKAVNEGITDREKIQILESMLNEFGADGTEMVQKELATMRKRVFGK